MARWRRHSGDEIDETGETFVSDDSMEPELVSDVVASGLSSTSALATPAHGQRADGSVSLNVYGTQSTFGSEPWWSAKGWWKLTSDAEANDVRAHNGTLGPVALAAVSLRGNKHRLRGEGNQDSFGVSAHRRDPLAATDSTEEFLVVAVSDGMGSAAYSSFSARMVAADSAKLLRSLAEFEGLAGLPSAIHKRQHTFLRLLTDRVTSYREAEFDAPPKPFGDIALNDLQCTLTFAVVPTRPTDETTGDRRVLLGFVGDSPAFKLTAGTWEAIEPAKDHDGLWSSSTQGVLGATEMLIAEVTVGPDDALLLSSDGVGNFLIFNGAPTAVGIDLASRWRRPLGLHDFIRDVSFDLQTADDDRTAAMIWFCDRP